LASLALALVYWARANGAIDGIWSMEPTAEHPINPTYILFTDIFFY